MIRAKLKTPNEIRVKSDPFVVRSIRALNDVDTSVLQDGAMLVYFENEEKWVSTPVLSNIEVESGQF